MTDASVPSPAQQYWDGFYQDQDQGQDQGPARAVRPNPLLVREVGSLAPGTALDLGCGEGGDAIWLAGQGWRVTAVDVSATVLRRAAARALDAGVADSIRWERHDLPQSFPAGLFDLVSAQFLHSPVAAEGEREKILRGAADAVAPGGVLLVISHAGWPSWLEHPPFEYHFPTTREVLASLDLPAHRWHVEVEDLVDRELTGPGGQSGRRQDSVLRVRRTR
ncbi:SAM-dependent methyltransferase [Streptoalloteichus hindustanus]|uniref:Methyltransferase domain-containing protein n=1 Tax=Streptoalloteichus hindustanus TaxID=2017 RepID=A0A1M5P1D3_STRHI|nr:class I SAM-dependent methyltransferase [Streptoalloteichus hindustanus]SHG95239.1 Methyltransferase domain-containing protein [Streptoalloteichus hindustanus]